MKIKYPIYVMVFGVVTIYANIMPPLILSYGPRRNSEVYIKCLKKVDKPRIERMAARRSNNWQKEFAPCNTNRNVRCLKISVTTSPLKSGCLIPQIAILLLSEGSRRLREKPKVN